MLSLQEESLKQVISYYKENEDCYIWFNEELIPFKRFMDSYEVMDICKFFVEEEAYYVLEINGVYHTVSTSNPEDSWEQ